jgi:branched-chain amino acid transport system ATP-binding protein
MLELKDIQVYYGSIRALSGVSLRVNQGELVALIGSNGAGKSTTLKAISGLLRPRSGGIIYQGQEITRAPTDRIVALGISHCPEGRRIFGGLTVRENLLLGAARRKGDVSADLDRVYELFPRLKERSSQKGGTLSGGEQQMLAIGRAMMTRPRVLLLDEPSLGLAPILVKQIFDIIQEINSRGITILLVEQNAIQALKIASRGYVLQTGEVVLSGSSQDLRENETVRKAYLGED